MIAKVIYGNQVRLDVKMRNVVTQALVIKPLCIFIPNCDIYLMLDHYTKIYFLNKSVA